MGRKTSKNIPPSLIWAKGFRNGKIWRQEIKCFDFTKACDIILNGIFVDEMVTHHVEDYDRP